MCLKAQTLAVTVNCIREYVIALGKHYRRKAGWSWKPLSHKKKRRLQGWRYNKRVLNGQDGNDRVKEIISRGTPSMIARLGSIELSCIAYYLRHGGFTCGRTFVPHIRQEIIQNMGGTPGFFPLTDKFLDQFCVSCMDQIADIDILGVWYNDYEYAICNKYCPRADLVDLFSLEPFHFRHPWSYVLKGKKVLFVHPFAESITYQYSEKRQLLWDNPEVLPDFELKTVKTVVSMGGAAVPFATWFDAYNSMCEQISKVDFDIAIIGAGSYGLSLASFIKRLGKQAIHLGGVSQILFGIRGKRWETFYGGMEIYQGNAHWCRPSASETISEHRRFEDGAYW